MPIGTFVAMISIVLCTLEFVAMVCCKIDGEAALVSSNRSRYQDDDDEAAVGDHEAERSRDNKKTSRGGDWNELLQRYSDTLLPAPEPVTLDFLGGLPLPPKGPTQNVCWTGMCFKGILR